MIDITEEDKIVGRNKLASMASELLVDKNRIAKAIAAFIRNKIEDFHVNYLSDKQMRELNPLIRNAIFTFLCEYGGVYASIATITNEKICSSYILKNTLPFLKTQQIPMRGIREFKEIIIDVLGIPFTDLSKGGLLLAGYEMLFVPEYWEDCVYCDKLNSAAGV